MKKILFGVIAATFVLASCDKGNEADTTMPEMKEAKTFADSVAHYVGEGQGWTQVMMINSVPEDQQTDFDKAKILAGMKAILMSDTSRSYQYGMKVAIDMLPQIAQIRALGIDIDNEQVLASFARTFNNVTADTTYLQTTFADYEAKVTDGLMEAQYVMQAKIQNEMAKAYQKNVADGAKYIDSLKVADPELKSTESGLVYKVNAQGAGAVAKKGDNASVKIDATSIDGTQILSTQGNFNAIPVDEQSMWPGLLEAVTTFPAGTNVTLYMPENLAFGQSGDVNAGIEPGETIIVNLEIGK